MSLEAITLVRALPRNGIELQPRDRFVLYALADYADENYDAWPSFRSLMEWTGYSRQTIIDALASLEEVGMVVKRGRRRDDGSMTSNTYRISRGGSKPQTTPSKPRTPRSNPQTPPSKPRTGVVQELDGGGLNPGRGVVRGLDPMIPQYDPPLDPPDDAGSAEARTHDLLTSGRSEARDGPLARTFFSRLIGSKNAKHPQCVDNLTRWYQDHGEEHIREVWGKAKSNPENKPPLYWFIDALDGLKPTTGINRRREGPTDEQVAAFFRDTN